MEITTITAQTRATAHVGVWSRFFAEESPPPAISTKTQNSMQPLLLVHKYPFIYMHIYPKFADPGGRGEWGAGNM